MPDQQPPDQTPPGGAGSNYNPKSHRPTVHQRVTEIVRLILDGATIRDIREYAVEQRWGVSPRQVREYKTMAMRVIDGHYKDYHDRLLKTHYNRLMRMFSECRMLKDNKTAHGILIDMAKLSGLYPAKPGTVSIDAILLSLQAVDRLVGDLIQDDTAFTKYREGMLGIVQGLQRLVEKGG